MNLSLRAVLIDDELPVRRTLRGILASMAQVDVAGEAGNVTEGLDLIAAAKPDLIFLDIKMPVRSGFDLLDELTAQGQFYGVIFVSGYPDEALAAVQKAAPHLHSDFLVKPINPDTLREKVGVFYEKWRQGKEQEAELLAQLETALGQTESSALAGPRYLIFQNAVCFHRIEVADVMYCEAANKQIHVYCSRQEHLNIPNVTLDALERLLPPERFVRIGKSHILNREAISFLDKTGTPRCRLVLGQRVRELVLYASNVEKVERTYL